VRPSAAFDPTQKDASYESTSRATTTRSGDFAYWDDEGYLYICDRTTDMTISGGMNSYPAEDRGGAEQPPRSTTRGCSGSTVGRVGRGRARHGWCGRRCRRWPARRSPCSRASTWPFQGPRSVDFMDELPASGSGKILKRQLRAPSGPAGPPVG